MSDDEYNSDTIISDNEDSDNESVSPIKKPLFKPSVTIKSYGDEYDDIDGSEPDDVEEEEEEDGDDQ